MKAVYAGSFDPVTNGHMDIITRGAALYDELIVAVGHNINKSCALSLEDRTHLLNECVSSIKNVTVMPFNGLLVNFAALHKCRVIIRGLRVLTDFELEFQLGLTNMDLNANIETIFLLTSPKNIFISSSMVKEILFNGGDIIKFVPSKIYEALLKRFN